MIVAVLVLAVLAAVAVWMKRDPFESKTKPDYSKLLPARAEGSIDKIAIKKKDSVITAEKRENGWWITEPRQARADDNALKEVADTLEKVGIDDIASKKKERQPEYGLSEDSPDYVEVKAFSGGSEVLSFVSGKQTPDFRGSFIRLATDVDTVFITNEPMPAIFDNDFNEWRGKHILDVPVADFERLRLTNAQGSLELEKDAEGKWRKKDDPNWYADQNRLSQVMNVLGRLPWAEIVDEPEATTDYGFQTPTASAALSAKGKDYELIIGKELEEPKSNYWAKLEGDTKIYQVRKPQVDRLTKEFDFYKGEPPEASPQPGAEVKPEAGKPSEVKPVSPEAGTTPPASAGQTPPAGPPGDG